MKKKLKIVLISYVFFPHTTPRAFRVFELAKYFLSKGHEVTVYTADNGCNYGEFKSRHGMNVVKIKPGFLFNKKCPYPLYLINQNTDESKNVVKKKNSKIRKVKRIIKDVYKLDIVKKLYEMLYLGGDSFEFSIMLFKELVKDKNNYDLMISVGLPVCSHIGSALSLTFSKDLANVSVADYGDPFSYNMSIKKPGWFHPFIERNFLKKFNFVSVPIKEAIPAYDKLNIEEKIRIIPQGLNIKNVKLSDVLNSSDKPEFAYAGGFMLKYRNPSVLLDYLSKLDMDFRFTIYTSLKQLEIKDLLFRYKKFLGEKLIIKDLLPRDKCIYELSKFDFLLKLNNQTAYQSPSIIN